MILPNTCKDRTYAFGAFLCRPLRLLPRSRSTTAWSQYSRAPRTASKRLSSKGFTLIEILLVISIFIILAGLGLFATLDSYRAYSFRAERDIVVSLLEKARNQSLSNINQSPHGFCFDGTNYIVFEGAGCASPIRELTPAGSGVTLTPTTEIIFSQLKGDASWTGTLTLAQGIKTTNVSVNSEGMIDW